MSFSQQEIFEVDADSIRIAYGNVYSTSTQTYASMSRELRFQATGTGQLRVSLRVENPQDEEPTELGYILSGTQVATLLTHLSDVARFREDASEPEVESAASDV